MSHNSVELQLTAVFCISNLVWSNDEGVNSNLKKWELKKYYKKF